MEGKLERWVSGYPFVCDHTLVMSFLIDAGDVVSYCGVMTLQTVCLPPQGFFLLALYRNTVMASISVLEALEVLLFVSVLNHNFLAFQIGRPTFFRNELRSSAVRDMPSRSLSIASRRRSR